jgi:hypothetical protein
VTKQTRQIVMLVALVGVFGSVMAYQFWPADTTTRVTVPSNPKEAGGMAAGTLQVAHVNMDRLQAQASEGSGGAARDPFRFKPKAAAAAATSNARRPLGPMGPPVPPLPPPPTDPRPEIRMKYLGFALAPNGTRIAVLQDDPSHPTVMGKQGDVIDGRYRLLRVDTNEVELSYLDGGRRRRFQKGQ